MENKKEIRQKLLSGERALFASSGLKVLDSVFHDGESPLKESSDIEIDNCIFKWKYPLWYSKNITVKNTTLLEMARSGIWYTHGIEMTDCIIDAPKTFRRTEGITLKNVTISNAQETMWNCGNINMRSVSIVGDYFGMNSRDIYCDGISVSGNYLFDGAENVTVKNSRLISKDAFWNCKNVTVENCTVIGEYLAWNSVNVTFINCTIESNQGLCYLDGIKLVNCKLIHTDLAFEYAKDIDADIVTSVDSIKNPISGSIILEGVNELILEETRIDPSKTLIEVRQKNEL